MTIAAQTAEQRPPDPRLPTLFVVGDSTANNSANGARGWGDPFAGFFDPSKINVVNRARAGRSSRTFLTEGLWGRVLQDVKAGDFVLIQFGHNDGGALDTGRARGSLPGLGEETKEITKPDGGKEVVHTFGWYNRKLISDVKAKGATPVLLSLTVRNIWKDGRVERGSGKFREWTEEIARAEGVAFVDVTRIIADRYEALGQEKVRALFGPDHTHTSPDGAEFNASAIVAGLKGLKGDPLGKYFSARGREVGAAFTLPADAPARQYLSIPLQMPQGYAPGDASAGDLDGDGEYELVVHMEGLVRGGNNGGMGAATEPILHAYKLDGTLLWALNLGRNIRESSHHTQFMVYDLDGDGRAEVACKTADGTVDGRGKVVGDHKADWRNPEGTFAVWRGASGREHRHDTSGHVLSGPEYLTVFDGLTGAALATTSFIPARHPLKHDPTPDELTAVWGDGYGNRVDRFLACVAYLDGERPSLVMARGYYTRTGKILWKKPSVRAGADGEGPGRGLCLDIDPRHAGFECWVRGADILGLFDARGRVVSQRTPRSCNFGVYWDGDALRELLDRSYVSKWNWKDSTETILLVAEGCVSNNGTKAMPTLSADLLGDWREEVVWRAADNRELRDYTTTVPTAERFYTFMHDPQYRLSVAWQNVGYNQPPHTSFFVGEGMRRPPRPNISTASSARKR